jgi:hypothetical protein
MAYVLESNNRREILPAKQESSYEQDLGAQYADPPSA